jgi:ankyrin repeat protein
VLIPLLIITIIQSRVSNLIANLTYMKEYAFEHNVTTGVYGYALSTLEGVIQYLVESEQQLEAISAKNEQFWSYLRDGDYEHVKDIYDEENEEYLNQSIQSLPVIENDGLIDEDETTVAQNAINSPEQHGIGALAELFDEKEASESVPMRPRTGSIRSLSSGPRSISVMQTRDSQANNALLLACMSNNAKLVEFLLERQNGCGPRDVNNMHRTPLMIAAMNGNIEVVRLLLKDKYVQETIDREDIDGNTALLLACAYPGSSESGEVVQELIDCGGARLRVSNHQGNNPLHVAAIGGEAQHKEILLLLCKIMSKDLLIGQNAEGSTVFHLCNEPDVCYNLIHDRGVYSTIADKHGRTPLMSWSLKGNKKMVQFFLEEGNSRLDQIDIHGQSALHLACSIETPLGLPLTSISNDENMEQVLDIVRMLLANMTVDQLHQRDWIDGNTPLHISTMKSGGFPLVKLLLEKNASLDIYNNRGQRPVYVAKDQKIIDLLDGEK